MKNFFKLSLIILILSTLVFAELKRETTARATIKGTSTVTWDIDFRNNVSGLFHYMILVDSVFSVSDSAIVANPNIKAVGREKINGTWYVSNDTFFISSATSLAAGLNSFEVDSLEEYDGVRIIVEFDTDTCGYIQRFKWTDEK